MKNLVLNGAGISDKAELHASLAQLFSFPDYYGKNLDALFDCLTDICEETTLTICGMEALSESLGQYYDKFAKTLKSAARENEVFHFNIL